MTAPLLTVADVAQRLGVKPGTVYTLVAQRRIACVRVGVGGKKAAIRFTEQDVEAYIAKQRVAAKDDAPLTVRERAPRRSLAHLPEARRYA